MFRFLILPLFLIAITAVAGEFKKETPADLSGYWRGAMIRDGSVSLVGFEIEGVNGRFFWDDRNLFDIPAAVSAQGDRVEISVFGIRMDLRVDVEVQEMVGTIDLRDGAVTKVHLKRRPWAPVRPYRVEEVSFDSRGETLRGSLILPMDPDRSRYPAVILLAGRSYGSRHGMYPFALALARHGIAALAFDGRGSETTTIVDRISDGISAFSLLAAREDIDASRIGLLGESTGSWVAPLVAARDQRVAFLVFVVGPAEDLVAQQGHVIRYRMLWSDENFTEEELDAAEKYQRDLTLHLIARGSFEDWAPRIEEAKKNRWSNWVYLHESFDRPDLKFIANQPYDTVNTLEKTRIPLLALYGGADFIVPPEENVPLLRRCMERAGNDDYEIVVFDGADHNLCLPSAVRGGGEKWPERFHYWSRPAPGAYEKIVEWVLAHTSSEK